MNSISRIQSEPRIVAHGLYRVDLGKFLGRQEIHVSLLERAEEGDFEQVISGAISRSGSHHVLIAGVMASAVYSSVQSNSISLPSGEYSLTRKDIPMSLQSQVVKDFAQRRKNEPDKNHILVCPTSPDVAADGGLFDRIPGAEEKAAVYVMGYGKGYSNLLANFYKCVNCPRKAQGYVHSIVSLYDSTRILNQDLEKLESIAAPVEKLKYFWDMESLRWGPISLPTLLETIAS